MSIEVIFLLQESDNLWILAIFESPTIGLGKRLANKRKSPHFVEGYNTWCALLSRGIIDKEQLQKLTFDSNYNLSPEELLNAKKIV